MNALTKWNLFWEAGGTRVTEGEKEYVIKAELPEVRKEDVKVTLENGTLLITGERKFKEKKGRNIHALVSRSTPKR